MPKKKNKEIHTCEVSNKLLKIFRARKFVVMSQTMSPVRFTNTVDPRKSNTIRSKWRFDFQFVRLSICSTFNLFEFQFVRLSS